MIALLVALAISNMPPPPRDTCKETGAGTACRTQRRQAGVCVKSQCPKTEYKASGDTTVMVDCLVCREPGPDGGTK
jgi:hypothetical protein